MNPPIRSLLALALCLGGPASCTGFDLRFSLDEAGAPEVDAGHDGGAPPPDLEAGVLDSPSQPPPDASQGGDAGGAAPEGSADSSLDAALDSAVEAAIDAPADAASDASPSDACTAVPTTVLALQANLFSGSPALGPFDPQSPASTANLGVLESAYDARGVGHDIAQWFGATGGGSWDYHVLVDGSQVVGGTPGEQIEIASGTLLFAPSGALYADAASGGAVTFVGAPPQTIEFSVGTPLSRGGSGVDGVTSDGGPTQLLGFFDDGRTCP